MSCLISERRMGRFSLAARPRRAAGCAIRNPEIGRCFLVIRKFPFRSSTGAAPALTCHAAKRRMSPTDAILRPTRFRCCFATTYCKSADPGDPQPITGSNDPPQHRSAESGDSVIDKIDGSEFEYGRVRGVKHGYAILGSDQYRVGDGECQSVSTVEIGLTIRFGRCSAQRNEQSVGNVAVHPKQRRDVQIVSIDRQPIVEVRRLVRQNMAEIDTWGGHGCGYGAERIQRITAVPADPFGQTTTAKAGRPSLSARTRPPCVVNAPMPPRASDASPRYPCDRHGALSRPARPSACT